MCINADNSCREEKLGCEGCYYKNKNILYNRTIGKILHDIIINNYYCRINNMFILEDRIIIEIKFNTTFIMSFTFIIKDLLKVKLNEYHILDCIDVEILKNFRKIK